MQEELDRCFDYVIYCRNKLLEMINNYPKEHNGEYEKESERNKRFRAFRNSEEWQTQLPEHVVDCAISRLADSFSRVIAHNKKIKESKSKEKFWKVRTKSKKTSKKSFTVSQNRILKGSYRPKGKNFTFGITLSRTSQVKSKYRMMEITELPKGLAEGTGRVVSATIFKRWGEYYVSFCMEILQKKEYPETFGLIGVDPGLKTTLTLSNGVKISYPDKIKKLIKKAEYYQSRMDKRYDKTKKVQSKRYYRARAKFWRTMKHIACLKKDWIHKITTKLANHYKIVKWEDVEEAKLERSNKIKSKKLRKALHNANWFKIKMILNQKLKKRGGELILVPCLEASTQKCSECGYIRKGEEKLTLNDRTYVCPHCGYTEDRDINAAKNIAKYRVDEANS